MVRAKARTASTTARRRVNFMRAMFSFSGGKLNNVSGETRRSIVIEGHKMAADSGSIHASADATDLPTLVVPDYRGFLVISMLHALGAGGFPERGLLVGWRNFPHGT